MNFWEYLDKRAARRDARRRLLLDKRVDGRTLMRDAIIGADPRFLISASIIGLFAWAFAESEGQDKSLMLGALIAAFAGAWGFYLGSSSGSKDSASRADKSIELATAAVEALPRPPQEPEAILQPGESARAAGEGEAGRKP